MSDPLQPMDCSPPSFSVHGILQARKLEWIAFFSRGSSQPKYPTCVSCIGKQILYHQTTWEAPAIEYSITFNSSTTLFFSQYVNSSHTMLISRIQKKTKQNKTKQNSVTKGTFQGNVKSFLFLGSRISRVWAFAS